MSNPELILPLEKSRQKLAEAMIQRAFRDDPAGLYATADPVKRAHLIRWFAHAGLAVGFHSGAVFANQPTTGVAIWLRPGAAHLTLCTVLEQGGLPPWQAGLSALWRFFKAMAAANRVQKRFAPEAHWYLLILAVDPACQGQGWGGRLIRPLLERADAESMPCYLETANPRSVPFYVRHGFQVCHQDRLPGSAMPFWGLKRQPG